MSQNRKNATIFVLIVASLSGIAILLVSAAIVLFYLYADNLLSMGFDDPEPPNDTFEFDVNEVRWERSATNFGGLPVGLPSDTLDIYVIGTDGEPVLGYQIMVFREENEEEKTSGGPLMALQTVESPNGKVSYERVFPGDYAAIVYKEKVGLSEHRFTMDEGKNTVTITLDPLWRIEGRIEDGKTGKPIPDYIVPISPREYHDYIYYRNQYVRTDKDGKFSFKGFPENDYMIGDRHHTTYIRRDSLVEDWEENPDGFDIVGDPLPSLEYYTPWRLYPEKDESRNLYTFGDVDLQKIPTLHLSVVDSEGNPAAGVPIYLLQREYRYEWHTSSADELKTDADGRAEIPLVAINPDTPLAIVDAGYYWTHHHLYEFENVGKSQFERILKNAREKKPRSPIDRIKSKINHPNYDWASIHCRLNRATLGFRSRWWTRRLEIRSPSSQGLSTRTRWPAPSLSNPERLPINSGDMRIIMTRATIFP